MAQATHGSAPEIAGQSIANPYAMILSAQMLIEWLHSKHQDPRLLRTGPLASTLAVEKALGEAKYLTPDVGGTASTEEVGDAVAELCMTVEPGQTTEKG